MSCFNLSVAFQENLILLILFIDLSKDSSSFSSTKFIRFTYRDISHYFSMPHAEVGFFSHIHLCFLSLIIFYIQNLKFQ